MKESLKHPIFKIITECAEETDVKVYVIGGWVRDLLLNRPSKDIDILVVGSGIELARMVAKRAGINKINYFKNFGTANLRFEGFEIEFVGARKESYRKNSRKPIVEDGSLEDDQRRRDFTINALGISLNAKNRGELIDPFGGIQDMHKEVIRTPLDPLRTFSDDPLRMMRAIRFATQLNFTIENNTLEAISRNTDRIKIVSKERIVNELTKIIACNKPSKGFLLMLETGLLSMILPEMAALKGTEYIDGKGHKDNFYHTLEVLDKVAEKTDDIWIRWAAILHDIAKPVSKKYEPGTGWTFHAHDFIGAKMVPRIFKRLKLPLNEKMKFVKKLVQLHLRPIALTEEVVTDSAVRRLLFDAGNDLDPLMTLCEADITSKNPVKVKRFLNNFKLVRKKLKEVEAKDKLRNWQPPITGEIIMKTFNIPAGRVIGDIKNQIRDAILDDKIDNTFDEAFELAVNKGKELGFKAVCSLSDFKKEKKEWEAKRNHDVPAKDENI